MRETRWRIGLTRELRRRNGAESSAGPRDRAGADLPERTGDAGRGPSGRSAWDPPAYFLPALAAGLAAVLASAGLAAGALAAGLAPFFSSAFFFLAVSRASPMIEHSS